MEHPAGPYQGHPSYAHWSVFLAVSNDYQLYRAAHDLPEGQATDFIMSRLPVTSEGVTVTRLLAQYAIREVLTP